MNYPKHFENIIGFGEIKQYLVSRCVYESTKRKFENIAAINQFNELKTAFNLLQEWMHFSNTNNAVLQFPAKDFSDALAFIHIENYFLPEEELWNILQIGNQYKKILELVKKNAEIFPSLYTLFTNTFAIENVVEIINTVIDKVGKMLPYASSHLGKLNKEIATIETNIQQAINRIFNQYKTAGFAAETDITIRDEKLVLPIIAQYKKQVPGFVRDVSGSGNILYIEPVETLELNNKLTEFIIERKREIERILKETTKKIAPYKNDLLGVMGLMSELDFLQSKAEWKSAMDAEIPAIVDEARIHIQGGVNPILKIKNKAEKKAVIPFSLWLDNIQKMIVISGPNAGGKSVVLKSTILLQYMVQCGIPATALAESEFGIFENYAIDCGDNQSISDGLSTFSAHLVALKNILENANKKSLIAIDEIGSGTDPRFGAPIAKEVLELVLQKGAKAVIATHFGMLKEWAAEKDDVLNAGMAYDTNSLTPLYKLQIGKAGSSFALELMKKLQFNIPLIEKIKSTIKDDSVTAEQLLVEAQLKQNQLEELIEYNEQQKKRLDLLTSEYFLLKDNLQKKKNTILENTKIEGKKILDEANKKIESTIKSIKQNNAEKEFTKIARKELVEFKEHEFEKKISFQEKENIPVEIIPILFTPGMMVVNKENNLIGEIIAVKENELQVVFGVIKLWINKQNVELIDEKKLNKNKKASNINWIEKQSNFSPKLDVRGKFADDTIKQVELWLEEAYTLGQNKLKIVHGKGDGILRKQIRTYLKNAPYVKNYSSEHEDIGGDGATVIELF